MTNTYNICGIFFGTRKEIITYIQSILYEKELGFVLDKEDFGFVLDLLRHHPEAKEKIGCGIKSIKTGKAKNNTTCFYLQRNDGF